MKTISEIKELLAQSSNPGNISVNLMAFFLYLKEMKRVEKKRNDFNAFAMSSNEIDELAELIERMIMYCDQNLRFQIAISRWDRNEQLNHWSFLEFNFNFNEKFPSLDILICDPLGFSQSLVLANLLSSEMKFGGLSKLCTLKIYIPTDILQVKGRTCAYFVTDSISMLSNQDNYCPIYDYMNSHAQEGKRQEAIGMLKMFREAVAVCYPEDELVNIYNFNIVISSLPVRLLRTKHSVSDLEKEVRDSEELREVIVNNKGEAAWNSINKNLFFIQDNGGTKQLRNMRVNKKMEKLEEDVRKSSSSITSLEDVQLIREGIQRHCLSGLEEVITQNIKTDSFAEYLH